MTTPLGYPQVAQKIGDHAPVGAVFHNRRFTGEILNQTLPVAIRSRRASSGCVDSERQNAHAFSRCIYIHGTPQKNAYRPAGQLRLHSDEIAMTSLISTIRFRSARSSRSFRISFQTSRKLIG